MAGLAAFSRIDPDGGFGPNSLKSMGKEKPQGPERRRQPEFGSAVPT
jgi:hypothetical protein